MGMLAATKRLGAMGGKHPLIDRARKCLLLMFSMLVSRKKWFVRKCGSESGLLMFISVLLLCIYVCRALMSPGPVYMLLLANVALIGLLPTTMLMLGLMLRLRTLLKSMNSMPMCTLDRDLRTLQHEHARPPGSVRVMANVT